MLANPQEGKASTDGSWGWVGRMSVFRLDGPEWWGNSIFEQSTMVSWLRSWHSLSILGACQVAVLIRKKKESWDLELLRTKEFEGID